MKQRLIGKTGAVLAIWLMAVQAQAAFTGDFAPSAWQLLPDQGTVQFINSDSQLQIRGPTATVGSSFDRANYVGPSSSGTPLTGTISFDWAFSAGVTSAQADFTYDAGSGLQTTVLSSGGPGTSQSGTITLFLPAGSTFNFLLSTMNSIEGKATSELLISNFTFVPEASTLWVGALLAGAFGLSVLRQVGRQHRRMARA
ncbi:MAG TPA: hypothetical protein VNT26_24170 [Candidatus Sulfotelmatobacter sp.]|nr:hypothetical protein [Candidatus Sulfotelmatobacter sp.]